jgi:hypothetical protein
MEYITNTFAVTKTGSNTTTAATSTAGTLPVGSDGLPPDYVYLTATAACHVRFSSSAAPTAVATDILIQANQTYRFRTIGLPYFAVIQDAAAGVLHISPLDI